MRRHLHLCLANSFVAVAQGVDKQRERRCVLASAWVIKVIARKRLAPVFQQADQAPVGDAGRGHILARRQHDPEAKHQTWLNQSQARGSLSGQPWRSRRRSLPSFGNALGVWGTRARTWDPLIKSQRRVKHNQ
jgi:hypothetical protein